MTMRPLNSGQCCNKRKGFVWFPESALKREYYSLFLKKKTQVNNGGHCRIYTQRMSEK